MVIIKNQGINLNPQQRRFVLRMIAEYKSTTWIVRELKERWNIDRSTATIEQGYKWNPIYKAQIEKYRKQYNDRASEHPLNNPQVILDYLKVGLDIALEDRDSKAIERLIDQTSKIKGYHAPKEIEVSHTAGAQSWEEMLQELNKEEIAGVIEVKADPLPSPILSIPEKSETLEALQEKALDL